MELKKIGVLTSGGDSPGMNAAIRAVVRSAIYYKLDVAGIYQGYKGLIEGNIKPLDARRVGNILQRGGTVLQTARCLEFMTENGMYLAKENLERWRIDALVTIGGNGTFTGAHRFGNQFNIPIIGIPGTIDNDLYGTDYTLGFDTAANIIIESVDRIRNTALSHNRLFFVEVMGRNSGYLAVESAVASGAAAILIPEEETSLEALSTQIDLGLKTGKASNIVIVAEGNKLGSATEIAQEFIKSYPYYETKVTVLGHIQRGGNPSSKDRVLASKMGVGAIEGLIAGKRDVMIGEINHQMVYTPLAEAIGQGNKVDKELIRISKILSI